jgi:hypothetical protein
MGKITSFLKFALVCLVAFAIYDLYMLRVTIEYERKLENKKIPSNNTEIPIIDSIPDNIYDDLFDEEGNLIYYIE